MKRQSQYMSHALHHLLHTDYNHRDQIIFTFNPLAPRLHLILMLILIRWGFSERHSCALTWWQILVPAAGKFQ